MEILLPSFIITGAILLGAMSPGPSFVLIARIAAGTSRRDGVYASLGMGIGGVVFCLLALLGIHIILTKIPTAYTILKVGGGLYLLYIAYMIYRGSKEEFVLSNASKDKSNLQRSFALGLFTQLANPKAAVAYSSIFAALLPSEVNSSIFFILPPLIFLVEAGWYLTVTLVLSSSKPRSAYLKSKSTIDKITAFVMGGLGVKLILD